MKVIGLFDYYFLLLIFFQFLISNLIDVKEFKKNSNPREAAIIKRASTAILAISVVMTIVAYILK
jgi:hypothetical protein